MTLYGSYLIIHDSLSTTLDSYQSRDMMGTGEEGTDHTAEEGENQRGKKHISFSLPTIPIP